MAHRNWNIRRIVYKQEERDNILHEEHINLAVIAEAKRKLKEAIPTGMKELKK
jgi:hypothetical protein